MFLSWVGHSTTHYIQLLRNKSKLPTVLSKLSFSGLWYSSSSPPLLLMKRIFGILFFSIFHFYLLISQSDCFGKPQMAECQFLRNAQSISDFQSLSLVQLIFYIPVKWREPVITQLRFLPLKAQNNLIAELQLCGLKTRQSHLLLVHIIADLKCRDTFLPIFLNSVLPLLVVCNSF